MERFNSPDFPIVIGGQPVLSEQFERNMQSDMSTFLMLAMLLIAILLMFLFRRVDGVVLPLIVVILGFISTVGLMAAVGVPFTDGMLEWPAGPRATDGAWADHWYDSVRKSTGFGPHRPREGELPEQLRDLAEECAPHYRRLYAYRLTG